MKRPILLATMFVLAACSTGLRTGIRNPCLPDRLASAPLKKYLMCITDGWPGTTDMNTYLLESPKITGPWKMVTFMRGFGRQGYFSTFPSKFISADGRTAWLSYSANFHAIHRVAGVLRRRGGGRGGRSGRARFPARVVQQRRA